jgi:hypothetical protein
MGRLLNTIFWIAMVTLGSSTVLAVEKEELATSAKPQRELIYCAGYMTHEEREAYRARMRAAHTPEEKAAVRQAHQKEMRTRLNKRGIDPVECEPQYQRERLRLRQRGVKQ